MSPNQRIRREILARLERAEAEMRDLPPGLQPLWDYYRAQPLANLVKLVVDELVAAFPQWRADQPLRAAGVEWYYDGRDEPDGLGYGYAAVKGELDFGDEPPGGGSAEARDDFNGGLRLERQQFGDSAGVDVAAACFPLYQCAVAGWEEDAGGGWDALINVFTLRMFHALHLAAPTALASPAFAELRTARPFSLWANNHDWDPFLVYVLDRERPETGDYAPGESADLRVPVLAGWLAEVEAGAAARERKRSALRSLATRSPAEWDLLLRELPVVTDQDGGTFTVAVDDLKNLGSQTLSQAEYYSQISFSAFAHLFRLIFESEEPGLYDLHHALVYLFLNDPKQAAPWVAQLSAGHPERGEAVRSCATNALRWAREAPETRWPNPTLALSQSRAARQGLKKIRD